MSYLHLLFASADHRMSHQNTGTSLSQDRIQFNSINVRVAPSRSVAPPTGACLPPRRHMGEDHRGPRLSPCRPNTPKRCGGRRPRNPTKILTQILIVILRGYIEGGRLPYSKSEHWTC